MPYVDDFFWQLRNFTYRYGLRWAKITQLILGRIFKMCGRYNLKTPAHQIASLMGISKTLNNEPRFNIAPSQEILVVRRQMQNEPELVALRWGLIPSFVKDPKIVLNPINARSETITDKPFFRQAFKRRRCLIPADGYYEWKAIGKSKQPYLMHNRDSSLLMLAGIWETWISEEGEVIESVAMLTTRANQLISTIHNRMPVIVKREHHAVWLDQLMSDKRFLSFLCEPYSSSKMEFYPVSTIVNSARNETPECEQPIGEKVTCDSDD